MKFVKYSIFVFLFLVFINKTEAQKIYSFDNNEIHYITKGSGNLTILFIPGLAGTIDGWVGQIDHFAKNYKVVAVDLPGFGKSGNDRNNWTIENFAKDVKTVVDKLKLDNIILVGHSMGGSIILEAAKSIEDKILVLVPVDVFHDAEYKYTKEQIDKIAQGFEASLANPTLEKVRSSFVRPMPEELIEKELHDLKTYSKKGWVECLKATFNWQTQKLTSSLSEINIPVVCINSDKKEIKTEAGKKYNRLFEIKSVSNVGHAVMYEAPKEFNVILENVIDDVKMKMQKMNLVETEFAFAEATKNTSVRDGFLKFIDDEGILFRPHPVNGKDFLEKSEARPGKLLWYPSASFISEAGDMGANIGPWEFRKTMEEDPLAFGNFVTVWEKQKDGSWKFLIDMGNGNNKPEMEIPAAESSKKISGMNNNKSVDNETLFNIEKNFINKNKEKGFAYSYGKLVGNETIILRDNSFPIVKNEIHDFLHTLSSIQKWEPLGGAVSVSKDFGYTYGKITTYEMNAEAEDVKPSMYYLHVWYYNNGWKMLIDVASGIPEEQ